MIAALTVAALLLGTVGHPRLAADVAAYDPHTIGSVSGKVYEERRRPDSPDQPIPTAVVWLIPRSAELVRRLEEIKQHARDSLQSYRSAADRIRREREAYERALWGAGGADLVFTAQVDESGRFSFDHVPQGAWLVLGWRSVVFDAKSGQVPRRQRNTFALGPRLDRYQWVTVWLSEITVEDRLPATVDLTDRNAWFTGVLEEMKPGASR